MKKNKLIGAALALTAVLCTTAFAEELPCVDGAETAFEDYNINGNNFFKLRDVCSIFDIGVNWNSDTSSIEVDTSMFYEA